MKNCPECLTGTMVKKEFCYEEGDRKDKVIEHRGVCSNCGYENKPKKDKWSYRT